MENNYTLQGEIEIIVKNEENKILDKIDHNHIHEVERVPTIYTLCKKREEIKVRQTK